MKPIKPIKPRLVLCAAALAAVLLSPAPLRAIDPSYFELLRDGIHEYDRGNFPIAARSLRLACFGMLDEPVALAECLARLALAQDKATDREGFRETFRRLVVLEERFQAYSQSTLPPEVRGALEARLAALIPAATLAGSPPAFRTLAGRKPEAQTAKGAVQDRRGREQPRSQPPAASPPAAPPGTTADPANTTPPAVAPAGPRPTSPITEEEQKKLATAKQLLAEKEKARDLRQAFQLAREVADAHPDSREAHHLAGEAAYRVSRWQEAAAYLQNGGGPGEDEPERLFYLAVSLYESGKAQAAAEALRRSLPNLQRSPYIDSYTKKILGSEPPAAGGGTVPSNSGRRQP